MTRPIADLDVPLPTLREQIAALGARQNPACRCDEPDADPYSCEAEPEDCMGEFPELNPFGGARPVNERSAEVSRKCSQCDWRTTVWHVDDGSADVELNRHVARVHTSNSTAQEATS